MAFVFCFLFMEETNHYRVDKAHLGQLDADNTFSYTVSSVQTHEVTVAADDRKTRVHRIPYSPHKNRKTWLHKLYLFDAEAFRRPNHIKGMFLRPLILLSFPVISYAGFSWGSVIVWHALFNATASLVLGNPPYNFRASMVGLSFVGGLIGVVIGSLYTGKFGDWFVIRMARRNGGLMEPEHRQWLFVVSAVLLPASLILWVGLYHGPEYQLFQGGSYINFVCHLWSRPLTICSPATLYSSTRLIYFYFLM